MPEVVLYRNIPVILKQQTLESDCGEALSL
jgi:hypothetical protein